MICVFFPRGNEGRRKHDLRFLLPGKREKNTLLSLPAPGPGWNYMERNWKQKTREENTICVFFPGGSKRATLGFWRFHLAGPELEIRRNRLCKGVWRYIVTMITGKKKTPLKREPFGFPRFAHPSRGKESRPLLRGGVFLPPTVTKKIFPNQNQM